MSRNKRPVIPSRRAPNAPTFDNDFLDKQPRQQGTTTYNADESEFHARPSRVPRDTPNILLRIAEIGSSLALLAGIVIYFVRLSDRFDRIDKNAETGLAVSTRVEYKVDALSDRVKDVEQQIGSQSSTRLKPNRRNDSEAN